MDFAFSDEQRMLRDQARSFLAERVPPERVAALADSDDGWDPSTWRAVAELGWVGLSSPEDAGGGGTTFLDEAVLFEELGRALNPGPYFATVGLALPALEAAPDALRAVAAGEAAATFAWAERGGPVGLDDLGATSAKASAGDGGWRVSGDKELVADGALAELLVVPARADGGVGLWLVDGRGPGVTRAASPTVDRTRRLASVRLDDAPAAPLAAPGDAGVVVARIRLRARAALALEAVGVGARALELAVVHATERRQFGKPIGAYQAVSHQIVDTFVEVELARSMAYWAAWAVAEDDVAAPAAAAGAVACAAEAAVRACERSIQVHGGIGFTWEHPLHRYLKRAQWIESFEGRPARRRAEVAAALLDGP